MADPWMKFYTVDWMGESKLKLVSRAARSLWIDMLCLMHQAGTGRLEMAGRPMTEKELASVLGDNPRTTRKLLAELADARVSVVVDGSFVASSRMIEDLEKLEKDRSNGRMGGNPDIKIKEKPKERVNPEVKAKKPEAIAIATSPKEEADDYLRYLEAHPNSVEGQRGEDAFSALVDSGVDARQIIAAAKGYADHVKGWSTEAKVQQSDNFLDAERGKWREFIPKPKAVRPTQDQILASHAKAINGTGFCPASIVSPTVARQLIDAGLVTPERMKERGIAA